MSEFSQGHIGSGRVMTVRGLVPVEDLGVTLMHEHIFNDCRSCWNKPVEPERQYLANAPITANMIGELRMDPFANLQNCGLNDESLAISELSLAVAQGCRSVVEQTCRGIGRNPSGLLRVSAATGLNIVMGSGYYLQGSLPEDFHSLSVDDVAGQLVEEALNGVGNTGIKIGLNW